MHCVVIACVRALGHRYMFSDLKNEVSKLAAKLEALQREAAAEQKDSESSETVSAPAPAPAAPAGGDGRASMLAELMAKRAGKPAAPAASSTPATAPTGLCQAYFVSVMRCDVM